MSTGEEAKPTSGQGQRCATIVNVPTYLRCP
jgi:hypothetical protein